MSTFGSSPPSASSSSRSASIAPEDCNVPQPGDDGISSLTWSPTANNILVSTNWDSGIRCWDVQEQNGQVRAQPMAKANHEGNAPVLSSCFKSDGSAVFTGGCDKAVRMWIPNQTPATGIAQQIGHHDSPVKSVGYLRASNLVVSGGWDKKLKFWDTRSPTPAGVIDMPERVYDLDVHENIMVVATANRHVLVYDVSQMPREVTRKESPLKYQTRCVTCFTDSTGFAIGSIEGRVGIHYVQKVPGRESFAFKCHRQDNTIVYAVNAICFHNQLGTFATVGSDGVVNFWDKDNKQRLKGFNPIHRSIPCANFSAQGNMFAYASSYDWSKGSMHTAPGNEIFVHAVKEDEIRPKGKKTTTSTGFRR